MNISECAAGYGGAGLPDTTGCAQCTAGMIKPTAGNDACFPCAAGEGSTAPFTACAACPPDTYSANVGDPCSACNVPSETTDGLSWQTTCGKELYQETENSWQGLKQ